MTHHMSKLSRPRTAGRTQTSSRTSFAAAAPTAISAARASTALAMSMTVALRYLEGLVAESPGPFVTGATLTIADILLGITVQQYRSGTLDGLGPEVLEAYPRLRALGDAYAAHPGVVAYRNRGAA